MAISLYPFSWGLILSASLSRGAAPIASSGVKATLYRKQVSLFFYTLLKY
jgi:hypothetical protein